MRFGDDLTVLKGIGPARQQWLKESFGVQTFSDLASLSPTEIERQLKEDGQIARRGAIEEWVAQAKKLAGGTATEQNEPTTPTAVFPPSDWQPFASFVVEIQSQERGGRERIRTAVQHIETDANETWPGIEREKLCSWIVAQVDQEVDRFVASHPPILPPVVVQPAIELTIEQVDIWQQPAAPQKLSRAERPFAAILQSQEPFTLTTHIIHSQQNDDSELPSCSVQVYARDLLSGKQWLLGQTTAVSSSQLTSMTKLQTVYLPKGQYRLTALAATQQLGSIADYFELPFVQVI